MERYRFYEVDLLRFLAAFAVVMYHYGLRGWAADDMSLLQFPELGQYVQYGQFGVHLFFIISGFVVLMSALNKTHTEFIISRVIRLYPAFWFAVTLTTIFILLIGNSRYDVSFGQYLANMTMFHKSFGFAHIDGVYWSLVVELKFYFLVFLLIIFKQVHNIKFFLGAWLGLTVILNLVGTVPILTSMFFPQWAPYFIAGAVFFLIRREGISKYYTSLLVICLLISLSGSISAIPAFEAKYGVETSTFIVASLILIFYLFFLALSLGRTKFASKPIFLYLGVMTYPLYLIHENIGFMIFNLFHDSVNKYVLLISVTAIMLVMSYLISTKFEGHTARKLKGVLVKLTNRETKTKNSAVLGQHR